MLQVSLQLAQVRPFCCIYSEEGSDQVSIVPRCLDQQTILPMKPTQVFLKKIPFFHKNLQSSDQKIKVQSPPSFQPFTSQVQPFVQPMFMPYIEEPKMDWTVNDSLYDRFLTWKLKCENILDCELAMLPESKKCKKFIAWSGDIGMDQYVS